MKTKRKLTKRQLLNELLDAEEAQKKITASELRLENRERRLDKKREQLSSELANILFDERVKSGEKKAPIIYKQHMFNVRGRSTYNKAACDIESIKSVS